MIVSQMTELDKLPHAYDGEFVWHTDVEELLKAKDRAITHARNIATDFGKKINELAHENKRLREEIKRLKGKANV